EELYLPAEGAATVTWKEGRPARAEITRDGGGSVDPREVRALAEIAALNADVEVGDDGEVRRGSGTERGLAELGLRVGYPVEARRRSVRRAGEGRRAADRAFMPTVHDHPERGRIELVKGAPEQVMERCDVI